MKIVLDNRALIKVSGEDSEVFLQSQFSNDIKQIQHKKIQINAYCQHQGKIIALLWVFVESDYFYLSIPSEIKELVLSKLNMFKLMSKIEIEDLSNQFYQYGLIDEKNDYSFKINDNLSLLLSSEQIKAVKPFFYWEIACINDKLPEIYRNNSDRFIPQALNLDIKEIGVSFTKGCYPGQEVVARMHYLGKPKRRLFRFVSRFEVAIGDRLDVKNSKSLKSAGEVIRLANKDGKSHFLGVFEVNHINDEIFLNNDQNKLVNLIHD